DWPLRLDPGFRRATRGDAGRDVGRAARPGPDPWLARGPRAVRGHRRHAGGRLAGGCDSVRLATGRGGTPRGDRAVRGGAAIFGHGTEREAPMNGQRMAAYGAMGGPAPSRLPWVVDAGALIAGPA